MKVSSSTSLGSLHLPHAHGLSRVLIVRFVVEVWNSGRRGVTGELFGCVLAHIVLDERINFPLDNPTFIEGSYLESIPRSPLRKGFPRVVPSNGKMLRRNPFGSCCPNPERQNFPWPQRTCEP